MRILGNCGQCGKSIQQTNKTCGATYAVCGKCKMLIHPHCLGEHKLMHNNQEYYAKHIGKEGYSSFISKFLNNVKNLFSSSKE
jgi:hypothetical protein